MKIAAMSILLFVTGLAGCSGSIPGLTRRAAVRTDDLVITLKRTACFGTCPVYELTIDAKGNVAFDGQKHTKTLGNAAGKIAAGDIDRLIAEFNTAGFLDLDDNYDQKTCPEYATDMSTVIVSLRQNGQTKTVNHYLGCSTKGDHKPYPPGLRELEDKIDQAARTSQWIR